MVYSAREVAPTCVIRCGEASSTDKAAAEVYKEEFVYRIHEGRRMFSWMKQGSLEEDTKQKKTLIEHNPVKDTFTLLLCVVYKHQSQD